MLELLEMEESASSHSASSSVCSSAPIVGFLRVCLEDFVGCDFFATVFDVVFFAVGFLAFFDFGSASSSDSTWEPLNIYLNQKILLVFDLPNCLRFRGIFGAGFFPFRRFLDL